ncbi:diaminobutyrate--2-oxoglutarate transaminase [Polycladomyces subterraneus]|uniref:Diaminobutyrate--2-oxoglutarate transaminase n=1 Tax=Polycladomyces subterraneus TaxID=1016997 RepID=A0ABT8INE3_9BACL|nr:diaminobutyrate--2-oxoglutarate transaminase [Polycladomyces subterraneus]MDN4594303.1 diaminobutyrate--2-oxoglutarate transaminase [Polycladomyces subterraneus]
MKVFEALESEVRSYCRSFPTVFTKASGYQLWDRDGREYIDFFAGAGALNYGHNNQRIKAKLIDYLMDDGITHSLDMATEAKERLLKRFHDVILKPRKLHYKVMFPGPTGTNSVESALKIARKVTGRDTIMSFTNAFHGMTIGSLSITGNESKRKGAGIPLTNSIAMPFDSYFGSEADTVSYIERFLEDNGSGISLPAAIILETVQGEGGINVASFDWLRKIEELCRRWNILLIVDDVQVGCGRTGPFFSFEPAGIYPDIVCLSKSIGGYGIPLALTLIKPEYDLWDPGEHNGTFRGHNLGFVAATEALSYWEDDQFSQEILEKGEKVKLFLEMLAQHYPEMECEVRGRGLLQGIEIGVDGLAEKICAAAFERGLIMETSGPNSEVVKIMPPLTIDEKGLEKGLTILEESLKWCKKMM